MYFKESRDSPYGVECCEWLRGVEVRSLLKSFQSLWLKIHLQSSSVGGCYTSYFVPESVRCLGHINCLYLALHLLNQIILNVTAMKCKRRMVSSLLWMWRSGRMSSGSHCNRVPNHSRCNESNSLVMSSVWGHLKKMCSVDSGVGQNGQNAFGWLPLWMGRALARVFT
jgi:hypothetical protein